MNRRPPNPTLTDTLFPVTTLFRSQPTLAGNDLRRVGNQDHLLGMGECRGEIATLLGKPGEQALGLGDGEFRFLSPVVPQGVDQHRLGLVRSEEHTSELQSLVRISYAVFCLNKKTTSIFTQPK